MMFMEKEIDIKKDTSNSRKKWLIFGGVILLIIILVIIFFIMSSDDPIFFEPADGDPMGSSRNEVTAPQSEGYIEGNDTLEDINDDLKIYNASEFDSMEYCYPDMSIKNRCEFLSYSIMLGAMPQNICKVTAPISSADPDKEGFLDGCHLEGDCREYERELQDKINTLYIDGNCNIDGYYYVSVEGLEFVDSVGQLKNILDYLYVRLIWSNKDIKKDYLEIREKLDDYPDDLNPSYFRLYD